jgi:hypothetical protein
LKIRRGLAVLDEDQMKAQVDTWIWLATASILNPVIGARSLNQWKNRTNLRL